jgi:choice-of-anchor A domain-containing protein
VGGRLAVGGSFSSTGTYTIASAVLDSFTAPGNLALDVQTSITSGQLSLSSGNGFVRGGTVNTNVYNNGGGTVTTSGTNPINMTTTFTALQSYSTQLAAVSANSTVTAGGGASPIPSGDYLLQGTDPTLEVFSLPIADLATVLYFNVNPTATVLVNVTGTGTVTTTNSGTFYYQGGSYNQYINDGSDNMWSNVIFNFSQTTSLTLGGTFVGTVLAPNAAITSNGGRMVGGLIAKSYSGNSEFHDVLFTGGNLPAQATATPEPGTWAMIVTGVGCMVVSQIKRRGKSLGSE